MIQPTDYLVVSRLVESINGRKVESQAASFRDVPDLEAIVSIAQRVDPSSEKDLLFAFNAYKMVAKEYTSMGRFYTAGKNRMEALKLARKRFVQFGHVNADDVSELVADLLRDRNVYIDDNCADVRVLLNGMLSLETVDKLFSFRMNRRRTFKVDPVECSPEYLDVIDEIEERIEKNRTVHGMGACHEIWHLKREYLAELGIEWHSPATLNPKMHFD